MSDGEVLITGGGGYVGLHVGLELLRLGYPVRFWARPRSGEQIRDLAAVAEASRSSEKATFEFSFGDLKEPDPFRTVPADRIRTIVHSAANTRFNIDESTADQVNIEGTRRVIEFARSCPALESLVLVSTVYSAGLTDGAVLEEVAPLPPFANHYERSKWNSEALVASSEVPWRIARTATIVSDDEGGTVRQFNVIHKTMRLMYRGLLPIFPGMPTLPMFFVTGREVAEGVAAVVTRGSNLGVYNLCRTAEQSCQLAQWLEWAHLSLERDADFSRRRIMAPIITDLATFRALARSVDTFSRDAATRAVVDLVGPFAAQMFSPKSPVNQRAATLIDLPSLDVERWIEKTCAHLCKTDWGSQVEHRFPGSHLRWDV